MREYNKRSVAKSISWRAIATLTTMLIVFLFTREAILSIEVGSVEAISKMIFYYFHERAWNKIGWGITRG